MGQDDKTQPLPQQDRQSDTQKEQQHNASTDRDKPEDPPSITDYASI